MRRDLWIGLLLAGLTLAVFWPVRNHEFIAYDDPQFVTENTQLQSGLSWKTVGYAFTEPIAGNWHPVTTLSHALDCELFGVNSGAHHLVNAVFHALNAALLFLVLQQLTAGLGRAGAKAAARAGSADLRSAVAQTSGLPGARQVPRPERSVASRLEVGVTADWKSALRRWATAGTSSDLAARNLLVAGIFALHPLRVESVAWLAERKDLLAGLFFLLSLGFYAGYARRRENGTFSACKYLYFGSLLCFALGLMSKPMVVTLPFVLLLVDFWPLGRLGALESFERSRLRTLVLEKVPFFLFTGAACWITLQVQKTAGAMLTLSGSSGWERISNAVTSYVRYLGKLFWPSDLAAIYPHPGRHYYLSGAWPGWEVGFAALLLLLISVLCVVELRRRPYLAVGWFWYLGTLVPVIGLVQVGEQAMADRYTYLPLIGPVLALVWGVSEAGVWVCNQLKHLVTGELLVRGIRFGCLALLYGLLAALTRHQLGYWQNTVSLFDHTIAVTPDNPSAQFALGVGLEAQGQASQAMVHYRVAVAIDQDYTKAYYNMGQLLRKAGFWEAAARAYETAARLNPKDVPTQLNLASVLPHLGRSREAVNHFNRALELDPNSLEGLNNLAWLLCTTPGAEMRDGVRAVQLAERACKLTGFKTPVFLGTLAAAYAEAGRFAEAVATAQNAAALASVAGDAATASKNQELAEWYRARKPYRDAQTQ